MGGSERARSRRLGSAVMTEHLRRVSSVDARAWVSAALVLGFLAVSARLVALFASFPPHPWVYLLLAVIALVAGVLAIVLAGVAFRRNAGRWAVIAMLLGGTSIIEMMIQFARDAVLVVIE